MDSTGAENASGPARGVPATNDTSSQIPINDESTHTDDSDEFGSTWRELSALLESDASDDSLESAILHLGALHDQRVLDPLVGLRNHPRAGVRRAVAEALPMAMIIGDQSSSGVAVLIGLCDDDDAVVRDWAACSLGRTLARDPQDLRAYYDTDEIRAALSARLNDTDPATRAEACAGLALRGVETVIEPLRRELGRSDVGRVPVIAAEALGSPKLHESLIALRGQWSRDPPLLERAILACQPGPTQRGGEADRHG